MSLEAITPARIMAWAVPGFVVLIAIEWMWGHWRGRSSYRGNDAINSLGLGLMSQITEVFTKALGVAVYAWCSQHLAILRLPADSLWVWLSGLLLYDFLYYWLHRAGHRVNLFWAAHVVHHQSEDYNLSTALRQTSTGAFFGWLFYLPMAVLGYPVQVFAVVAVIDLLYQFWIHTDQVGRLGWFDRVFTSPSNHRAHHAANDRYLDRNYGGILILWDRMFGTFIEENDDDPPIYGTRAPLRSWNPLWANAEVYWAIAQDAWRTRRWRDKLLIWIKPPGWRPQDVARSRPKAEWTPMRERFDPPLPRGMAVYGVVQFGLIVLMAQNFLDTARTLGQMQALAYAAYLLASLCVLGTVMESRPIARWLEPARTLVTACVPMSTGVWFGTSVSDARVGVAMAWVFGASCVAYGLLNRRRHGAVRSAVATQ